MKWHHVAGLLFGLVTLTWVFSGLMSMNPWKIFDGPGVRPDASVLAGVKLERARFALTPQEAIARAGLPVRELAIRLTGRLARGPGRMARHGSRRGRCPALAAFDGGLRALADNLLPGHKPVRFERVDAYDNYYYARRPHTMTGHGAQVAHLPRGLRRPGHVGAPTRARDRGRLTIAGVKRCRHPHSFRRLGWPDHRPLWEGVDSPVRRRAGRERGGVVIGWRRLRRKAGEGRPKVKEPRDAHLHRA
jgi:hypothetical protein